MYDKAPGIDFLKSIELFENFPDDALRKLLANAKYLNSSAGASIFSEGDPADCLYVVVTGDVSITKKMTSRSEKLIAVLGPSSVFGEMALFAGQTRRIANAKAKSFVNYFKIDRTDLRQLLVNDMDGTAMMFKAMLLTTFERLERTNRELATVYEISRLMTGGLTLKQFCQSALEVLAFSIPNVDSGLVYVLDEAGRDYALHGSVESDDPPKTLSFDAPIIRAIGNKIIEGRAEPAIINDPAVAQRLLNGVCASRAVVALPFAQHNQVVGFTLLLNKKGNILEGDEATVLLNSIAIQLSNAINSMRRSKPLS